MDTKYIIVIVYVLRRRDFLMYTLSGCQKVYIISCETRGSEKALMQDIISPLFCLCGRAGERVICGRACERWRGKKNNEKK